MPDWLDLLVLALLSTFWPTLILIVVLALRVEHPVKILVWFLAGGLLTTVTVGFVIVMALQGASFMSGSRPPADPAVNITIGLLSLLAAFVLNRRAGTKEAVLKPEPEQPAADKKPPLVQRAVQQGAPVAFAAGVVLNIIPGTFPIVALKDIAEMNVSNAETLGLIIAFYVIMFAFVEVPIVAYLFAPERTSRTMTGFNAWLGRNARRLAVDVLAGGGLYLIVRGVIELLR